MNENIASSKIHGRQQYLNRNPFENLLGADNYSESVQSLSDQGSYKSHPRLLFDLNDCSNSKNEMSQIDQLNTELQPHTNSSKSFKRNYDDMTLEKRTTSILNEVENNDPFD